MFGLVASIPSPSSGALDDRAVVDPRLRADDRARRDRRGLVARPTAGGQRRRHPRGCQLDGGVGGDRRRDRVPAVSRRHRLGRCSRTTSDASRRSGRAASASRAGSSSARSPSLWAFKRRGIPPAVGLSTAAPALALAQAIGRWGNWFNQELFGKPTDLPWALRIDDDKIPRATHPAPRSTRRSCTSRCGTSRCASCCCESTGSSDFAPAACSRCTSSATAIGRFWVEGLRIDPAHHHRRAAPQPVGRADRRRSRAAVSADRLAAAPSRCSTVRLDLADDEERSGGRPYEDLDEDSDEDPARELTARTSREPEADEPDLRESLD